MTHCNARARSCAENKNTRHGVRGVGDGAARLGRSAGEEWGRRALRPSHSSGAREDRARVDLRSIACNPNFQTATWSFSAVESRRVCIDVEGGGTVAGCTRAAGPDRVLISLATKPHHRRSQWGLLLAPPGTPPECNPCAPASAHLHKQKSYQVSYVDTPAAVSLLLLATYSQMT